MNYYLPLIGILFVYVSFWYFISLLRKRNDVADVVWGLGFVVLTWSALHLSGNYEERQLLITALVTLWGLRLAWHIHTRNSKKEEDYRYQAWREVWGKWFIIRSYFQVYILQGALLFLIALPILYIQKESYSTLNFRDLIGGLVWAVGFFFEVVGDFQLRAFTRDRNNKGKILTTGLWRYTRHPNYFGEVTIWWGIWIIAGSVTGSFWLILSPLTITYLILKVSGIPLLEKKYAGNQEFAEYKQRTNSFFPWFPSA
jgi:steroid 5-alpha reductase family enzyme